jgi:hypothetical protein
MYTASLSTAFVRKLSSLHTLGGQVTRSGLHPLRKLKERNLQILNTRRLPSLFDKHVLFS